VFRIDGDGLELTRRLYLPGGPYGIAVDHGRGRLWVTLPGRNEVVELPAHGRPHVIARRATVRQPDSVAVDAVTGRVVVTGRADGVLQVLDP
jgi:DNA-binding beta-propeller fold protein YncE